MATIDKTSLREKFAQIKEEYKSILSTGKVAPEVKALIDGLVIILEVIIAIFLEKQTSKNSRNSSKPSSQTSKDESSCFTGGSNSKGKKLEGKASNTRTVTNVTVLEVKECCYCGENLREVASTKTERRTKIDIVFEKVVEHEDAEEKRCPNCEKITKGSFSSEMQGPLQYGSGIKSYIIYMLVFQMVSLNRIQSSLRCMIGEIVSEAIILKYVFKLYLSLEQWEEDAKSYLVNSPSLNGDETSMRVDKKNYWTHVYSAGDVTLKLLHRKRGREAIDEIGILPEYKGVIVHDCWSSYFFYENCRHALCGSHLLRELQFIMDSNGYTCAKKMKSLLQEACKKVSLSEEKKLTELEFEKLRKEYRELIEFGKKELPELPPKPPGKKGKIAKPDSHNLWERLEKHEESVLRFAELSEVSFTNNRAERDLRMGKVKQKVSGCFRVEKYAKAYCRISSYLQTMSYKGYNPLVAIQMALSENIPRMS